jgi:hypothetical protein
MDYHPLVLQEKLHELAGLDSIDLKLVLISAGSANFALDD